MGNLYLYLATVFIWGTSFYAIRLQLPAAAAEASIFYRFTLATLIFLVYCLVTKKSLRFNWRTHMRFALMGIFLFNLNFLFIYYASGFMATGITSVIFSSVVIFNMLLGRIFLQDRLSPLMIAGAITGVSGICLIFSPEVSKLGFSSASISGLTYAFIGTAFAALGMILSALNQRASLPIMQSNAWGMFYGALFMLLIIFIKDISLAIKPGFDYFASLFYLAVFASVLGFTCFLTLVGRIGAGKASYATVLFPILALALSTWLEDYVFTNIALLGVAMALIGNALILMDKQK